MKRLSTIKNLPSIYPDANFTESTIRWLVFNAQENGFHACVRRMGRRVLIDLDSFEDWLDVSAAEQGGV